jgi:F-type H+-transporting ATPase subunit delta
MSRRAGATKEARALFDVALAQADPVVVGRDLDTFVSLVASHPDLARVVTSPMVPPARKRAVVGAIADAAGFSPIVSKLLRILAERHELSLVEPLAAAYRARLMQHQRIVEAHVTTAVALPDDRRAALEASLREATGKTVRLSASIDPSILGGVVTRIGSVVFDGSVSGNLERLRHALAAGV